jgi:hypothetical protein
LLVCGLSDVQKAVLSFCIDHCDSRMPPLLKDISRTASTGMMFAQLQEKEQQQDSTSVLPEQQRQRQLLNAHAKVLQRYEVLLNQWQLLWVQVGVCVCVYF